MTDSDLDPFNLNRFIEAQGPLYTTALSEIQSGLKRSHWMWFIFPQIAGLAFSAKSKHFAISVEEEARAYLEHSILGPRLIKCAETLIGIEERSANQIFGDPDDLKLLSCATLFARVSRPDSVFAGLIDKYFGGEPDAKTLEILDFEGD